MSFFSTITDKLIEKKNKGHVATIVFPEGTDERIIEAALRLKKDGIVEPILLGKKKDIENLRSDLGKLQIIDPVEYPEKESLIEKLLERRKGKLEREKAEKLILDENYFGTMLVYTGKADGMISGAIHTTADTVRPALQIIKTKPGVKTVSGLFVMERDEEIYFFADCAINIVPNSEELATIAYSTYESVKTWGFDPKIAMLSFSTKGSADHENAKKMSEATKIALTEHPELPLDGELQFDAAFVPQVAKQKAPDSKIAGHANTFIFPSLEAGNIGYKIAQRLGGFKAVGPILQGLNAPINDLSRGCNAQDVYDLALVTASTVDM